jgi:transposase
MSIRNQPRDAAVFGVDIGKTVFHVVGLDSAHAPIQKATFRRETLLQFFERASPVLVGMEACPGSQWLARKLQAMGHTVRIVPAQFVKPFVKSNKNDIIDAEAIAEAVTRPTMRFVEMRTPEQIDLQALHRVRDRMIAHRTRLISQMRAFCLEYGIAIHQGAGKFKAEIPRVLADETNELTPSMRRILTEVHGEMMELELRIAAMNHEIEAIAARSDTARRLMTVPGIGPLASIALLAAAGSGRQFRKARDLAAWLGLVPREVLIETIEAEGWSVDEFTAASTGFDNPSDQNKTDRCAALKLMVPAVADMEGMAGDWFRRVYLTYVQEAL